MAAPEGLEVTIIGSSGTYAAPGNPCSGYLVRSPEAVVLLDCGPGVLGPLQELVELAELTAVVMTHCHPDHWLELPVLRNAYTWFHPRTAFAVYGTAQTQAMDAVLRSRRSQRPDPLDWNVIDASSRLEICDQRWRFSLTDHPVETLAARIDCEGRSFAFSSDTAPGWNLSSLGYGIDVAMCEASHSRSEEGSGSPHLSARQAALKALDAEAQRLVLTHLAPGQDAGAQHSEASDVFDGPVAVARPGLRIKV